MKKAQERFSLVHMRFFTRSSPSYQVLLQSASHAPATATQAVQPTAATVVANPLSANEALAGRLMSDVLDVNDTFDSLPDLSLVPSMTMVSTFLLSVCRGSLF